MDEDALMQKLAKETWAEAAMRGLATCGQYSDFTGLGLLC